MLKKSTKILHILFTGGGTTGHVTKNLILLEALREGHPEIVRHYAGLKMGKEAELVTADLATFHPISSGKLRRYVDVKTIPDAFRFLAGIWQAFWLVRRLRPNVVFSSGGYVALPVAIGAWMNRVPVLTHETDSVPGLANRIIGRIADKVFLGYASAARYFGSGRTVVTGNPVSSKLFDGSKERALKVLGFSPAKKTILVMGGSQGSQQINELIWAILPELLKNSQVIHLTGAGNSPPLSPSLPKREGAGGVSLPSVTHEYPDFLTAADLVICRAGGNTLAELSALNKRAILIPLPSAAADHQRKNALEMQKQHPDWIVLDGKDVTPELLLSTVQKLLPKPNTNKGKTTRSSALEPIVKILLKYFS